MKKKIIPVVIVIIALLIGCVGYICYRNNEVKKYSAKIEKQLDKMDQLKGEAYFLPEHEKDLKNLKKNYETAKSNKSVGDTYIQYEAKYTLCVLSGLSLPYKKMAEIKEIIDSNKDTIKRNLTAQNTNRLSKSVGFFDDIVPEKKSTEKKKSDRDLLF